MERRTPYRALVVVLLAALATTLAPAAEAAAKSRAKLKAFTSCEDLVRYARHHAGKVRRPITPATPMPPTAMPAPTAGPDRGGAEDGGGSGDSSSTNVQEVGVDEPDVVKTDGTRIFALARGKLQVVDGRATAPRVLASLEIPGGAEELLVYGTRALVFSRGFEGGGPIVERTSIAPGWYRTLTRITEVDLSVPERPRIVRTFEAEGAYVSARLTTSTARVVISTPARALGDPEGDLDGRTTGWVPRATLADRRAGTRRSRSLAKCRNTRRSRDFSGLDMLTVLTIDMERGLPAVDADAIMTGGEIVYASPQSLYVATERWVREDPDAQRPPEIRTAIHRFDASEPRRTSYTGSGEVAGYMLSQWSMSEYRGVLRVASTSRPPWWFGPGGPGGEEPESESFVTTLEERDGGLRTLGRVGGLGRGERIYAVRFIEDVGFVVTFRQVDPLYTIDLAVPAEPRVLGELKILGYSAYLHPVGDDLLLGVGQDASEEGRRLGTQVSLFDVSDLRNPRKLDGITLGRYTSSEAEYDHHAFLWWPAARLAVIPVTDYSADDGDGFLGAVGFRVGRANGVDEAGRLTVDFDEPYGSAVRRTFVLGGRLFGLSELGLTVADVDSLTERARLRFP